jgi:hypothetical protein
LHKQLASTFKQLDSFEYAFYYSAMLIDEDIDSMSVHWTLEAYSCGLKSDDFKGLLKLKEIVDVDDLTTVQKLQFTFYNALLYVKMHDVQNAKVEFSKLFSYMNAADSLQLVKLVYDYQKHGIVNAKKAKTLSLIFPGMGQFYLHKPKSAINSIAINGLLISGFVVTAINYSVLDGVLFWILPVGHYYTGGSKAAGELAILKQKEMDVYYYNAFIKLLGHTQFNIN